MPEPKALSTEEGHRAVCLCLGSCLPLLVTYREVPFFAAARLALVQPLSCFPPSLYSAMRGAVSGLLWPVPWEGSGLRNGRPGPWELLPGLR